VVWLLDITVVDFSSERLKGGFMKNKVVTLESEIRAFSAFGYNKVD